MKAALSASPRRWTGQVRPADDRLPGRRRATPAGLAPRSSPRTRAAGGAIRKPDQAAVDDALLSVAGLLLGW